MTSPKRERAKKLLVHYFDLAGAITDYDDELEVREIVDYCVDAAKDEIIGNVEEAPFLVCMDEYEILQKTSGNGPDTFESKIKVTFKMLSKDTHSVKHEAFLNAIRHLLDEMNARYKR